MLILFYKKHKFSKGHNQKKRKIELILILTNININTNANTLNFIIRFTVIILISGKI